MNERIRQLADEAAKYSATMFLPTGENGDELFVAKFAQLIVAECAQLVQGVPVDTMGYHTADQKIKEHFGVK